MFVPNALICHLVYGRKCNPAAALNIFFYDTSEQITSTGRDQKKKKTFEIIG